MMIGRLRLGLIAVAALLASFASFSVQAAQAQEVTGRFRVLVPNLFPEGGADDDFGEDVAEQLRDRLNDLATHQPVPEDELEDALDRFDLDMEDLNCIRARQLAGQINAQLVLCGSYTGEGGGYSVDASFISLANNESFDVPIFQVGSDADEEAAQNIFDSFDTFVQQTRFAQFCGEYAQSQQWENALENCNRAIELSPQSESSHYTRGRVLMELDRQEEALEEMKTVLEINPIHENALQTAGYLSIQMDQLEEARGYYREYLELNPGNASVRMRVAYDMAQEGDPVGAMQFIEAGLEVEPDNMDLWEQYANFAFAAAQKAEEEAAIGQPQGQPAGEPADQSGGSGGEIPPEARELYTTALEAFQRVYEAKGAEMNVSQIRSMIASRMRLGQLDQALSLAEQALETHGEEAVLWSIYADALGRAERIDEAIAALDSLKQIDPDYANLAVRQGRWLLDEGRIEDAMPYLREAIENGEQPANVIADMVFAKAYQNGVQQQNWTYAINMIEQAKQLGTNDPKLEFWHGYAIFNRARAAQEPQTLQTAQETLPQFRRALELFQAGQSYANEQPSIDYNQFITATNTFIEIQEAIIERGR